MYRFLQEDRESLLHKRDALIVQLQAAGKDIGDANRQSSETWHDNAPLDVAQRNFERLGTRLTDLEKIIHEAVVVRVQESASSIVDVGSEVTFVDQDNKEQTVRIGSYIPKEGSQSISYAAPVAALLMGSRVGDIVEGTIAGRDVEFEVRRITRWV